MKVLFLGSPAFSVEILKEIMASKHQIVGVVTQPDRPSGRGHKLTPTAVKTFAQEKGIKVFDFEKVCNHIEEIKKIEFDISVTASFGQILRDNFLELAPCINVHPSLLPKYRGATPIQSAILNGDKETGVTIMKVVRAVDAGDILAQEKIEIADDEDFSSLEKRLTKLGGEMIVKVLDNYSGIKAKTQDEEKATFCKKISKEDLLLDLNESAKNLVNKVRALAVNGTYILINGEKFKINKLKDVSDEFVSEKSGEVLGGKKRFVLTCNLGAVEVQSIQSKSGRFVSGRDFLNGFCLESKKIN